VYWGVASLRLRAERMLSLLVLSICAAACFGALAATTASAAAPRQFGSEGEGAGEFVEASGIAVNQESGGVVIDDSNNFRLDWFSGGGGFEKASGWGVADGITEALQTCAAKCFQGLPGAGAGQLEFAQGVAIDNDTLSGSDGDIYVFDARNHRVEKYAPDGTFLLMFGGDVNLAGGNVCVAGEHCQAGTEGSGPGEFTLTQGAVVAVAPSGTVFVGDSERVQEFSPGGVLEGHIELPGIGRIAAVAVDSSEDIYVEGAAGGGVHKFDATGTELGQPRDSVGRAGAIAVGPAGQLFVNDMTDGVFHINEYDESGTQVASFARSETFSGIERGLAYDNATEELYLVDSGSVAIIDVPPKGPLIVEDSQTASAVTPTSATLKALVNGEGSEAEYHFEYGPTAAYSESTASVALAPSEPFDDVEALAEIGGLMPRSGYHFRVVVTNAASETVDGPDETFATLAPVGIDSESAIDVSATSARLQTLLNPFGLATEYHFEYGLSTAYEHSVPTPDASAGSGVGEVERELLIQGLAPSTMYHYRVVAHNALGVVEGEDRTFTTEASSAPALADSRGWEMVSPPDKQGISFESIPEEGGLIQASSTGDAITYIAKAPIDEDPAGNRSISNSQVLSQRSGDAWSSQDIATPNEEVNGLNLGHLSEYQLFSSDLSTGIVEPPGATPIPPAGATQEKAPYERRTSDGEFIPLVTASNVVPGAKFGGIEERPGVFGDGVQFVAGNSTLEDDVLTSPEALTSDATAGPNSLYELHAGSLKLVSILPSGESASAVGEEANVGFRSAIVRNAVSSDGTRVLFETTAGASSRLYVRLLNGSREETVRIDEPAAGVPERPGQPKFQGASADDSRIFFTDEVKLTPDASARSQAPDLYVCEVVLTPGHADCALKDLTVDHTAGEAADVQGVAIGSDEAGEAVYFVANGALAPGATKGSCVENTTGEVPPLGPACNLYVHLLATNETRLIAVLDNRDGGDWEAGGGQNLAKVAARVSPNGRYLTFMSQRSLTGYDNRDAQSGERDQEVYLYDLDAGTIRCASCNPSGARPAGIFDRDLFPGLLVDRPRLWGGQWLAASTPGWTGVDSLHATYQSRFLSNSGRLFFDAQDALVPQDANHKEDVYEYEPDGIGSCASATGCVALMSSGISGEETAFLDASESGDDVFFLTSGRLSSSDTDGAFDVYDAHVCTAEAPCPSQAPVTPQGCSETSPCRELTVPAAAGVAMPPTASSSGPGNFPPPAPAKAPPPATKAKPPTRAQKLTKALAACKKKKSKSKRAACVKSARKRYGPRPSAKARTKKTRKGK
jgi:hypothetical protein